MPVFAQAQAQKEESVKDDVPDLKVLAVEGLGFRV